ncbi:membrane protein [Candidatus Magnetoovum chiemensis]|nr:membrane protein [Candidatus Magnetoovum chiemensis]
MLKILNHFLVIVIASSLILLPAEVSIAQMPLSSNETHVIAKSASQCSEEVALYDNTNIYACDYTDTSDSERINYNGHDDFNRQASIILSFKRTDKLLFLGLSNLIIFCRFTSVII